MCIELQGNVYKSAAPLAQFNVAILVKWIEGKTKDYDALVADIASQLAWTVAAFREPSDDITFSRAKIEDSFAMTDPSENDEDCYSNVSIGHDDYLDQSPEGDEGKCWHKIFTAVNIAVGFPIPNRPDGMHGVELPFSLMTTFAGVGYPVEYKGGYVLKGEKNALFPVRMGSDSDSIVETSVVQWHLFGTRRSRLFMAEAKERDPTLRPVGTSLNELSPLGFLEGLKQQKRHFLGLYQNARICAGTADSRAEMILTARGQNCVQEEDQLWPIEWNRTISGSAAFASFGLSTGLRFKKRKDRQLCLTYDRNLNQHLDSTRSNFAVLYNVQTKTAWLLPKISVVMHLVQAWAKARYPEISLVYPEFNNMGLCSLERAFNEFQRQALEIDLEHAFKQFSSLLDQLQNNEHLKPSKGLDRTRLAGVDFFQLVGMPLTYSILSTNINLRHSGNWPRMLRHNWKAKQPYKVVTLFCNNISPQPIMPRGRVCSTWYPPPVGHSYLITTMYCLKELAQSYGRDPVKLSPKHVWERGTYGPYDACNQGSQ